MLERNGRNVGIGEAIKSLLIAKKLSNCRPRYIESLGQYLRLFARGREDRTLDSFDVFAIEDWLADRESAVTTRVGNIGRLSALFSFGVRRGWLVTNPCTQLERIRLEPARPKILAPDAAERLMRWVQFHKPSAMAYFSLALFAGIRPEETEKLLWSAFDGSGGLIVVDACVSKVRHRRIVELHPTALEWLQVARQGGSLLPMHRMMRRRLLKEARVILGFSGWPQDVLRHSAASYLMAKYRDAGRVADWLGNSPSILLRHYRELVTAEAAAAFWSIRP
jgi:integrase